MRQRLGQGSISGEAMRVLILIAAGQPALRSGEGGRALRCGADRDAAGAGRRGGGRDAGGPLAVGRSRRAGAGSRARRRTAVDASAAPPAAARPVRALAGTPNAAAAPRACRLGSGPGRAHDAAVGAARLAGRPPPVPPFGARPVVDHDRHGADDRAGDRAAGLASRGGDALRGGVLQCVGNAPARVPGNTRCALGSKPSMAAEAPTSSRRLDAGGARMALASSSRIGWWCALRRINLPNSQWTANSVAAVRVGKIARLALGSFA